MAALVRFYHCEKEGEHVKDGERSSGSGRFVPSSSNPPGGFEDGTSRACKVSVCSEFDIHKQFHAQKVPSMEDVLQVTHDPC
jgi:hypothetical protein